MKTRIHRLFAGRDEFFLTAMDPGGSTGMALLGIRKESFKLLEWRTVGYDPQGGGMPTTILIDWRLDRPGLHYLLYEDFHVRNTSQAAATDTTALKVIGAVDQILCDRDLYAGVFKQEPVQGKHMVTDEVLEKLDLHMGHQHSHRHVRDALRHAVSFLADGGYLPVCEVAFPRRGVTSRT